MLEPKLRFKMDDGSCFSEWKMKKLINVSKCIKVGFVGTCECYYTDQKGIRLYRTGNLQNGKLVEDDMKYVVKEFHEANKKSQLHKWDILIARHGNSGNAVLYDSDEEANCLNIVIIQPDLKLVNPKFIVENINSVGVAKQVHRLRGGSTQAVLNTKAIEALEVSIPCFPEQRKIADLLLNIDAVISDYQEMIRAWENRKKGVIQKLFSQKVRFKDDDGNNFQDWKEKKLGDTVLIERGGSPRPIEKYITGDEDGFNWIKIGDAPQYGNYIVHTAQKIVPEGLKKTRRVYAGDLILSNSMSFGKPYILEIDGCIHDGWLLIRDERNNYNKMYLCYFLGSEYMLKQYKKFAAGTGVNNLNKNLVANVKVLVPCIDEQQKIADCLSALDDVINDYKKTLAAWEELKKGLLQQMFV